MKTITIGALLLLAAPASRAQLAVKVGTPQVTGNKAVVKVEMKNEWAQRIDSARAVMFLMDDTGKVAGQATRWVIGGTPPASGLAAGATHVFHFVMTNPKPFTTTNLAAKLSFSRLLLEGGREADPRVTVRITPLK